MQNADHKCVFQLDALDQCAVGRVDASYRPQGLGIVSGDVGCQACAPFACIYPVKRCSFRSEIGDEGVDAALAAGTEKLSGQYPEFVQAVLAHVNSHS